MKRRVDYTWRLAELMAARGMHNSTDLIPLLVERGVPTVTTTGVSRGSSTPRTGFASNDRSTVRYLELRRRGPGHRDRSRRPPAQSVRQLAGNAQAQRGRAQQSGASSPSQSDQR